MSGKKRVVNENVEVEVVADATEKKGLFAQLAEGVKGAGNWCVKHWKGIAIGVAGLGAGLYMGGKLMEEDEDEVYLIEVEADFEEVSEDEDEESETETDAEEAEDNNEETED